MGGTGPAGVEENYMRAAPTPAEGAAAIKTTDLYDERGEESAPVSLQFQSLGGLLPLRRTGTAIRCFQDNAPVKSTLATPGKGNVLVVDGGGSRGTALMGAASPEREPRGHSSTGPSTR